eukprot:Hpha_TRINITY_DN8342_c0_g2::TRINITY_DN8342_c0_g2_i1::g.154257::m.154257
MNVAISLQPSFGKAGTLLTLMHELAIPPDEKTFCSVVRCCVRGAEVGEARRVVLEARRQGLCSPTLWQNLICVYQRARNLEGLRRAWKKMKREAVEPTLLSYVFYLRALFPRAECPRDVYVLEGERILQEAEGRRDLASNSSAAVRRPRREAPFSEVYVAMLELYAAANDVAAAVRLAQRVDLTAQKSTRKAWRRNLEADAGSLEQVSSRTSTTDEWEGIQDRESSQ